MNNENNLMRKPDNYLAWSILTTVLCCLPLGIIAIIKSSKVDTLWAEGLHDKAIQTAKEARKWIIISTISGVVIYIFYTLFCLIAGLGYAITTGYQ